MTIRQNTGSVDSDYVTMPKRSMILAIERTWRPVFAVYVVMRLTAKNGIVVSNVGSWGRLCATSTSRIRASVRLLRTLGLVIERSTGKKNGARDFELPDELSAECVAQLMRIRRGELVIGAGYKLRKTESPQLLPVPIDSNNESVPVPLNCRSESVPHETDCETTGCAQATAPNIRNSNDIAVCLIGPTSTESTTQELTANVVNTSSSIDLTTVTSTKDCVADNSNSARDVPVDPLKRSRGRPPVKFNQELEPDVWAVYVYWRDNLYPRRVEPTSDDTSRIRSRLKDGITVDQMKLVVDWVKQDPWRNGTAAQNKSNRRYDQVRNLWQSASMGQELLDAALSWSAAPKLDARGMDTSLAWKQGQDVSKMVGRSF